MDEDEAKRVSDKSMMLLEQNGYVIWKCKELNGDRITITISRVSAGTPRKYPVYTVKELRTLCNRESMKDILFIHEAVKLGGEELEEIL